MNVLLVEKITIGKAINVNVTIVRMVPMVCLIDAHDVFGSTAQLVDFSGIMVRAIPTAVKHNRSAIPQKPTSQLMNRVRPATRNVISGVRTDTNTNTNSTNSTITKRSAGST